MTGNLPWQRKATISMSTSLRTFCVFVPSVMGKNMLLSIGPFAQENAETCSVLLDACKLIVGKIVVLGIQAS